MGGEHTKGKSLPCQGNFEENTPNGEVLQKHEQINSAIREDTTSGRSRPCRSSKDADILILPAHIPLLSPGTPDRPQGGMSAQRGHPPLRVPGDPEARLLERRVRHRDGGLLQDHPQHAGPAERHEGHAGPHHRLHGAGQLQAAALPQRPLLQRGHQVDGDPQLHGAAEAELLRVRQQLLVEQIQKTE
ncbi:hypothetical protein CEXT_356261 [Caerostris extrusa]|uniref:Uncharacterized protein n=1 Tax=Caerostris extrusa TaxID=172846 RepID=A0AAV4SAW0_CAEEX|nr:hypothetical protein CEXT_356261 [Caerostris extrusa]